MVSSGGERFAIPQVSLLELVRLEGVQANASIERIGSSTRIEGKRLSDREVEALHSNL